MSTVQNGKGARARNNWGKAWYAGYDTVDWHHGKPVAKKTENPSTTDPKHGAAQR